MTGPIALPLLPDNVNTLDHPVLQEFKRILENIAMSFQCRLTVFTVEHGTVKFRFSSAELMNEMMSDLGRFIPESSRSVQVEA